MVLEGKTEVQIKEFVLGIPLIHSKFKIRERKRRISSSDLILSSREKKRILGS